MEDERAGFKTFLMTNASATFVKVDVREIGLRSIRKSQMVEEVERRRGFKHEELCIQKKRCSRYRDECSQSSKIHLAPS